MSLEDQPAAQFLRVVVCFPHSSVGKESDCNARVVGLIPGSGRSSGEGNGNPLRYSCLENPMDRGAWQATVYGVARVRHDWATKCKHASWKLLWPVAAAWAATFLGLWGWRLRLHVLWAKQKESMRAGLHACPFTLSFPLSLLSGDYSARVLRHRLFSPCRFKEFHLFHVTERKGDCDFFFCLVFSSLV